jgi:hypothetical protein
MTKLGTLSISISLSISALTATALADKSEPPAPIKPAPPAEAPKPAQELTDLGKKMAGKWKCTGTGDVRGTPMELSASITHKLDACLYIFWIQSTFSGSAPNMPPM